MTAEHTVLPTRSAVAGATRTAFGARTAFMVGWSSGTISTNPRATTDTFRGCCALLHPIMLLLLLLLFVPPAVAGPWPTLRPPRRARLSLVGWMGTARSCCCSSNASSSNASSSNSSSSRTCRPSLKAHTTSMDNSSCRRCRRETGSLSKDGLVYPHQRKTKMRAPPITTASGPRAPRLLMSSRVPCKSVTKRQTML